MNEEDPIKTEGARVLTRLYDAFLALKGNLLVDELEDGHANRTIN